MSVRVYEFCVFVCRPKCACVCIRVFVSMHECVCVSLCVFVCLYVCTSVCARALVLVCYGILLLLLENGI